MTTYQWCVLIAGLIVISLVASIPPFFLPAGIFIGLVIAVLLYRIGSSLEMGFNEHIRAMQAIYEEIGRFNRAADRGSRGTTAAEMD